jgi:hypothetical protein
VAAVARLVIEDKEVPADAGDDGTAEPQMELTEGSEE